MSDQDNADRPATFREVLASGEYRALYFASALSWFGDYVARAAVTSLVFQRTGSVAASAATFAISYVPWLGFGPILAALAERLPFRRTMITADILRMFLVALVALPGIPVWGMIALLFATALCNPSFDAARSALLAKVLSGDRYVVGLTLQTTSHQAAQVAGYLSGAGLSAVAPQAALLFNAATFGLSALLISLQVQRRPAALAKENRSHLLRETASGLRLVFSAPLLRGVAILVFLGVLFAVVPEGLAAAWAATLSDDPEAHGWIQGGIMIANPVGFIVGGLVAGRLLGPKRRQRLIRLFAIAVPATLAPAVLDPPFAVVLILSFLCGAATAGLIPATNGLFVQALPSAYRARAFGVMKSGVQVLQGIGVFVTGYLADHFELSTVIGVWGVLGVCLMGVAVLTWPSGEQIAAEIARTRELNKAAEEAEAAAEADLPERMGRRPSPRPIPRPDAWPPGDPDPRYGDPWGPYGGVRAIGRARVVQRDQSADDTEVWRTDGSAGRHAAAEPNGGLQVASSGSPGYGGRHSSEAVRRRISRPVGRIYSTESARIRAPGSQPAEGGPQPPDGPGEDPALQPGRGSVPETASASAGAEAGAQPRPEPGLGPDRSLGAETGGQPAAWTGSDPGPRTGAEPAGWNGSDPRTRPGPSARPGPGADAQLTAHQHAVQQHAAHQHALQQQRADPRRTDEPQRAEERTDPARPRPHPAGPL